MRREGWDNETWQGGKESGVQEKRRVERNLSKSGEKKKEVGAKEQERKVTRN